MLLCSQTKFRWRQEPLSAPEDSTWSSAADWAIDDVYIGDECPLMCAGRGHCVEGMCVCDDGYHGKSFRLISRKTYKNSKYGATGINSAASWFSRLGRRSLADLCI